MVKDDDVDVDVVVMEKSLLLLLLLLPLEIEVELSLALEDEAVIFDEVFVVVDCGKRNLFWLLMMTDDNFYLIIYNNLEVLVGSLLM